MGIRRLVFLLFIIVTFIFGFAATAGAANSLVLRDGLEELDLTPYMAIAEDRDSRWSIDDMTGPEGEERFTERPRYIPNYGYATPVHWVRLQVANESRKPVWLLQIEYAPLDRIDIYTVRSSGAVAHERLGDAFPFAERTIRNRDFTISLPIDPGAKATVYIRVETEGAMVLPMKLVSPIRYAEREQTNYLLLGAYYGVMLIMTIYNSILAFSLRSRAYFYYVLINASTLLLYSSFNGIAFQYVWPDAVWWNNRAIVFFMCMGHIAALLFTRSFLRLKPPSFPKLYHIFTACMVLELLNILVLFVSYPAGLVMSVYSIVVIDVFIIVSAVISWKSGYRPATYFIIGWGVFLLGAILSALTDAGYIPLTRWTAYASQVGSVFEAVILSWGLADRIHSIRKEKEFAIAQMNETRRLADSDDLTGLYNRRYVISAFEQVAKTGSGPMTLMLLDVDHFKLVNDTYGHDTGDVVLQKLARVLRASFRPRDIVGRFGGEEFMVLLQDTNQEQAHSAAEFLLGTIRKQPFVIGDRTLNCTVSIGIAEWYGTPEDDFHQVLLRADEALYAAKRAGRDRVCDAAC